jgi:hypothetical protein
MEGWDEITTPTNGIIVADPRFYFPDEGNFFLRSDSPAIDAGDPDPAYNDECLAPGLGTLRNDMGIAGGPFNCGWQEDIQAVILDQNLGRAGLAPDHQEPFDYYPDGELNVADLIQLLNRP